MDPILVYPEPGSPVTTFSNSLAGEASQRQKGRGANTQNGIDSHCDACRNTSSVCFTEVGDFFCARCEFHDEECTFLQSSQPRKPQQIPFKCSICGKAFATELDRNAHERIHRVSISVNKNFDCKGSLGDEKAFVALQQAERQIIAKTTILEISDKNARDDGTRFVSFQSPNEGSGKSEVEERYSKEAGAPENSAWSSRVSNLAKPGRKNAEEDTRRAGSDWQTPDLLASTQVTKKPLGTHRALEHDPGHHSRTDGDEAADLESIQIALLQGKDINPRLCYVQLEVDWTIREFMRCQYGKDLPHIGSVVAITGSALHAQATTCANYVSTTWPRTGDFVLQLLDEALREADGAYRELRDIDNNIYLNASVEITSQKPTVFRGWANDEMLLVEVGQQLAWIGSALSSSPFHHQMAYAVPQFQVTEVRPTVNITFEHRPLLDTEILCWLPLFHEAVIVPGFPIPGRAEEVGLEIPLEILVGIAGVSHAVEYKGGVVMKGFSHMLVPIRKKHDRIQWHLVSGLDPKRRLSYSDGLSLWSHRASLDEVSLEDLPKSRAFIGWCSVADSRLGSGTATYENIDYLGAADAGSRVRCSGASLGFQQFGMAALDFRFGVKDGKCHFQRTGSYENIVSIAEKTPVALYDTGEHRAWLVPASGVMLHIIQHRHALKPFTINNDEIKLDTSVPTGSNAEDILLRHEHLRLSDNGHRTFKDEIIDIWSLLEFLTDQQVTMEQRSAGTSIKGPFSELLKGFEFKAVVQQRSPFRQEQTPLKATNGGWSLLVPDIDALVLFANGFGDLIVPADQGNTGLCKTWQRVPKGEDYLATTTEMLKECYDVAGCRLSREYLTSTQLKWDQGDSLLFEGCQASKTHSCHCNRLQRIFTKSTIGSVSPPKHVVDQGAVIFGSSSSKAQQFTSKQRISTPKIVGIYSQPNVTLASPSTLHYRPKSDGSTFSNSRLSSRSRSDATSESVPDSLSSYTTVSTEDTLDSIEQNKKPPWAARSRKQQSFSQKRSIISSDGEELEPSADFSRKRVRSNQVAKSPHLSPLHCCRGPSIGEHIQAGAQSGTRDQYDH